MIRKLVAGSALLLLGCTVQPAGPSAAPPDAGARSRDVVYVASPTGEQETDRASILAALHEVEAGGTVLFASGTYLIGPIIAVETSGITLLGHPEGTTIRGCEPDAFADRASATFACHGLGLSGARQTVRNLTFEYTWHGLFVGCCFPTSRKTAESGEVLTPQSQPGGHLIEGNTFRYTPNGLRVIGESAEPTVVRDNRFIDVYHAVQINGGAVHVLDNDITVRNPERVPSTNYPGDAINILPFSSMLDLLRSPTADHTSCSGNIIARNRIEGYPDGIRIFVADPQTSCRQNEIRDNTIVGGRARWIDIENGPRIIDETDSTIVGVPLRLSNWARAGAAEGEAAADALIEDNLIEGNHIIGAEGVGIEILHASGNRIANNTFTRIQRREPFPGNTLGGEPERWREANGSGIWLSPGSDGNEIAGNTFEAVATSAVVLEGDRNRVELRSADDAVRDLGERNVVSRPKKTAGGVVPDAPPDAIRYVEIVDGHAVGERLMWQEAPGIWRYIYDTGRFSWTRSERLVLGASGLPVEMVISGEVSSGIAWNERFKLENGTARWFTPRERGEAAVSGPAYYTAINPAHDTGILARALLRQEARALPLLPEGEARLELLGETVAAAAGRSRVVRHFAIHGLDLMPRYVWLDQDGATFADEWSILGGWEAAFPALRAVMGEALARHMRRMAADLVPPARTRPLVIRNARLFDAETGRAHDGTTIIIDGERIAAVGPPSAVSEPAGAEVIDAAGRMALPGLWDMHAHHSIPLGRLEVDAPLHLAAGVTTARDLGSRVESLVALRAAIDEGQAIGPRILAAGYIDGAEGEKGGIGILVANAAEARAAVDRYAELGFVQIKTYNDLPADLVHVVIARAKEHGMRVSGHVPLAMTSSEAVAAGYDELQHIQMTLSALPRRGAEVIAEGETWDTWYQVLATLTPDSEPIREFISLLASHDVAIDATMAHFISGGAPPDFMADEVERLPQPVERRMRHTTWAYPYVPVDPLARPAWEQTVQNMFGFLLAAHGAGVPILVGTDVWPGWGLHHEMELYVRAGMTTTDVLTLATLGAARVMGMDDELGSIETGKLADLILVDGDPTEDISDIRRVVTVVKDGRVYDPAAIYRALEIEPCCEE